MKLTDKEAKILSCVEMQADLPIEQIRTETGLQEHTIRYHLHALEERGIIERRPFINMAAAGYTDVGIYLTPALDKRLNLTALTRYLVDLPDVIWLAELSGDFQLGMAFSVINLAQVEQHLQNLSERFPGLFYEKVLAAQLRAARFPRRYLQRVRRKSRDKILSLEPCQDTAPLDQTQKNILAGLARVRHRSRRQLAQAIGMPLSTLDARIAKLEKAGVLEGYVYDVRPESLGMQCYIILIFAKGLSQKLTKAIFEFAVSQPAVTFLYSCLGSWDFEMNIEVEDYQEVQLVIQALLEQLGDFINHIKVVTRHRELKYTFVPF